MAIKDNLETYDTVVTNWVRTFSVEGIPVETNFATADRPHSMEQAVDEAYRSLQMRSNAIVSVTRLNPTYNPKLRQHIDILPLTKDPSLIDNKFVLGSKYPRPYTIQYQLDFRGRSRVDANLWVQWIYFTFNPYNVFYVDFGPLWNTMDSVLKRPAPAKTAVQLHMILDSPLVDNSDLETGESERFIRWTVTVKFLNAFMFPVPELDSDIPDPFGMITIYKVVKDVKVDLYVSPSVPPIPDPNLPGVQLASTVRRAVADPAADMPTESR